MGSVSRDGASQQRMISATQNSPKRPNCVKFKRWHWDYRQIWLLPSICCHFHPDQYKTHWTLHCIGDEEAILKAMHPLSHKLQSDKFSNSLLFFNDFWLKKYFNVAHLSGEWHIFNTSPPPSCGSGVNVKETLLALWLFHESGKFIATTQTSFLCKPLFCSKHTAPLHNSPKKSNPFILLICDDYSQMILEK